MAILPSTPQPSGKNSPSPALRDEGRETKKPVSRSLAARRGKKLKTATVSGGGASSGVIRPSSAPLRAVPNETGAAPWLNFIIIPHDPMQFSAAARRLDNYAAGIPSCGGVGGRGEEHVPPGEAIFEPSFRRAVIL